MLWPIVRYNHRTVAWDLTVPAPSPPDGEHWLGTDDQARDVVARLIYGFRISVLFGFTLTIISAAIGVAAGAVQGYFGGWLDLLFQRFIEIWAGMPTLYLLIILASVVEPNFWWLLGLLLLFSWMGFVGVVRAEFLRARNFDYVRAARGLGVSDTQIMRRHVLPNAMVATLTFMPFTLAGSVTVLTSLDFLGIGLPPGSASLGELLAQGKANLQAPWLGLTGFFVIALMLSLLIFIGEAIRDAFDPRKLFAGAQPPEAPSLARVLSRSCASATSGSIFASRGNGYRPCGVSRCILTQGRPWPWWAKAVPANPSPRWQPCSCCPIRWPRIRLAVPFASGARKWWGPIDDAWRPCAAMPSP
jgi:microcin C transport system permease protein